MSTEIVVLFARGTIAGPAHVMRFHLAFSEQPVTGGTLAYGAADILFGDVGSTSVSGGIHVMVPHTLLTKEFAMALGACVTGLLTVTLKVIATLCLATCATFLSSIVDDLTLLIHGQDDDLVVGKMTLKGLEFRQPARTFGNASNVMQFLGFLFFNG